MGAKRRREINGRETTAGLALVAIAPEWILRFVRSERTKPIEFEKGKTAIAVPSLDKLPSVIDMLISVIRNGELDQQLAQSSKQAVPKGKAA